jgi:ATP-binding cassette, subfamily C (CFTR/MRP), member 1
MIPEDSASILSILTFWWFNEMIIKGFKHSLTIDNMWKLNNKYSSKEILDKFNNIWIEKINFAKSLISKNSSQGTKIAKTNVGILSSIFQTFWSEMLIIGFIKFIASMLTFVNPLVLDRLMDFMKPVNTEPKWRGFFYASLMFISPLLESILNSQYEFGINKVSMKVRTCLISIIYKKVYYCEANDILEVCFNISINIEFETLKQWQERFYNW